MKFTLSQDARIIFPFLPSRLMRRKILLSWVRVLSLWSSLEKLLTMPRLLKRRSAFSLEVKNYSDNLIPRPERLLKSNLKSLMFKLIIRLHTMKT